jgi:holo-[acyl-carrier protein] synthase
VRVGIDLVEVREVAGSIRRFGNRYLHRLFTPAELSETALPAQTRAARLAARFAAKEAAIKVLRPADEPLPWADIEISRHASGYCELVLHGRALARARSERLSGFSVSLSHEGPLATAIVIANEIRTRSPDDRPNPRRRKTARQTQRSSRIPRRGR